MESIAYIVRRLVEYSLVPFDALPSFWGLTLLSVITGVLMLWVVGRTTPQRRVEVARARIAAAIYEMRLFLDSPRRIFASQARMLGWSFAYVGYMMPAFLILSIPLGLLFAHADVRYGQDALPLGQPVLVRVDFAKGADGSQLAVGELPEGVKVTAPVLYIDAERRAYVRIEVERSGEYELPLILGSQTFTKHVSAAPEATKVRPERTSGWASWVSYGDEEPLGGSPVTAITIEHPDKESSYLGIAMPWWLYWLIVATIAAFALRKRMGVVI